MQKKSMIFVISGNKVNYFEKAKFLIFVEKALFFFLHLLLLWLILRNATHCQVFLDQICSKIISGFHGKEFCHTLSNIWEHCAVLQFTWWCQSQQTKRNFTWLCSIFAKKKGKITKGHLADVCFFSLLSHNEVNVILNIFSVTH